MPSRPHAEAPHLASGVTILFKSAVLRSCLGRQQLKLQGVVEELARITADDMGIEPAHRTPEPENLGAVEKKGGSGKPLAFVNREVAGIGDGLCQDGVRELLPLIEPDDQRCFWLADRFQHEVVHNNGCCSDNADVTLCRLMQLRTVRMSGGRLYVYLSPGNMWHAGAPESSGTP